MRPTSGTGTLNVGVVLHGSRTRLRFRRRRRGRGAMRAHACDYARYFFLRLYFEADLNLPLADLNGLSLDAGRPLNAPLKSAPRPER